MSAFNKLNQLSAKKLNRLPSQLTVAMRTYEKYNIFFKKNREVVSTRVSYHARNTSIFLVLLKKYLPLSSHS